MAAPAAAPAETRALLPSVGSVFSGTSNKEPWQEPLVLVHAFHCTDAHCTSMACRRTKNRMMDQLKEHMKTCPHLRRVQPGGPRPVPNSKCKMCRLGEACLRAGPPNATFASATAKVAEYDAKQGAREAWKSKASGLAPQALKKGLIKHIGKCENPFHCALCIRIRAHEDDADGSVARELERTKTMKALLSGTRPVTASVFDDVSAPSKVQQRCFVDPAPAAALAPAALGAAALAAAAPAAAPTVWAGQVRAPSSIDRLRAAARAAADDDDDMPTVTATRSWKEKDDALRKTAVLIDDSDDEDAPLSKRKAAAPEPLRRSKRQRK